MAKIRRELGCGAPARASVRGGARALLGGLLRFQTDGRLFELLLRFPALSVDVGSRVMRTDWTPSAPLPSRPQGVCSGLSQNLGPERMFFPGLSGAWGAKAEPGSE